MAVAEPVARKVCGIEAIAVRIERLPNARQLDAQLRRRLPQQRRAAAALFEIILIGQPGIVDAVDPARALAPSETAADRQRVLRDRDIDIGLRAPAETACILDRKALESGANAEFMRVGLHRDIFDKAADRTRAIQGTLRPLQHFDAVEVIGHQVDGEGARAIVDRARSDRRIVKVDADRLRRTERRDAAQRDRRLPRRTAVAHVHAGNIARIIDERGRTLLLDILTTDDADRNRNVLHILHALLGGDDDLAAIFRTPRFLSLHRHRHRERRDAACNPKTLFHRLTPTLARAGGGNCPPAPRGCYRPNSRDGSVPRSGRRP